MNFYEKGNSRKIEKTEEIPISGYKYSKSTLMHNHLYFNFLQTQPYGYIKIVPVFEGKELRSLITIITADTYTEEFHKIIFCNPECNNFKIWELCIKICNAYDLE